MKNNFRAHRSSFASVPFCAITLLACPSEDAHAGVVMLHGEAAAGDRELYFANITSIADRTPMDDVLGSKTVSEIEIIGVYEGAAKPDWAQGFAKPHLEAHQLEQEFLASASAVYPVAVHLCAPSGLMNRSTFY